METKSYQYGGARALVELHANRLLEFARVWKQSKVVNLDIVDPSDEDYLSLEHLLFHVLGCARGYMEWMCEVLELPDPGFDPTPGPEAIAAEIDGYVDHLIERWDGPLCEVEPSKFYRPGHLSRWKVSYCIDSMLEHAVMHPIRHAHQLERLMAEQGTPS